MIRIIGGRINDEFEKFVCRLEGFLFGLFLIASTECCFANSFDVKEHDKIVVGIRAIEQFDRCVSIGKNEDLSRHVFCGVTAESFEEIKKTLDCPRSAKFAPSYIDSLSKNEFTFMFRCSERNDVGIKLKFLNGAAIVMGIGYEAQ